MPWAHKFTHKNPKTAAFLLGGFSALGFAPLYLWPISLLCLAVFFKFTFAQNAQNPHPVKLAAVLGWFFGFGFSLASLWWMGGAFRYTNSGWWAIASAPFVITALAGVMGLWYGAVMGLASRFCLKCALALHPLIIATLWATMEALRTLSVYGLPWHLFGYVFAGNLYLIQPAAFGTVIFLSFLGVLFAAAGAYKTQKSAWIYGICVLCVFGVGALRVHTAPPLKPIAQATLYQTSLQQDTKWNTHAYSLAQRTFETLKHTPNQTDLIILPETVFTFLIQAMPDLPDVIDNLTPSKASTVYGIPSFDGKHYYNAAISTSGTGKALGVFDKKLLVPFGEFIPMQTLLPNFFRQFTPANAYSPGITKRHLETSAGEALPVICYEAIFPYHILRAKRKHAPDFIVNLTNDAWFAGTSGPYQHFAIARLRSVETGLSQVRATNRGISAFIDGYGRIQKRTKIEHSGYYSSSIFEQIK